MKFMIFDTKEECDIANESISKGMGLRGNFTEIWDNPVELVDGRWSIVKPEDYYTETIQHIEAKSIKPKEVMGEQC